MRTGQQGEAGEGQEQPEDSQSVQRGWSACSQPAMLSVPLGRKTRQHEHTANHRHKRGHPPLPLANAARTSGEAPSRTITFLYRDLCRHECERGRSRSYPIGRLNIPRLQILSVAEQATPGGNDLDRVGIQADLSCPSLVSTQPAADQIPPRAAGYSAGNFSNDNGLAIEHGGDDSVHERVAAHRA